MGAGGLALSASGGAAANGHNRNFQAHLAGENEVPAVDTLARGQSIFQLRRGGMALDYKLIVATIEDVLMAHIHLWGPDDNGPVAVWLYPDGPPPALIEDRFDGVLAEGTITDDDLVGPLDDGRLSDLLEKMRVGNTYVNVHTEAKRAGEIRGRIH